MKFLSTIKLMGKIGPIEESIINLTLRKDGNRKLDNLEVLLTNSNKDPLRILTAKSSNYRTLKPAYSKLTNLYPKTKESSGRPRQHS